MGWSKTKEGHGFGLVRIQRQPLQSRVGVESVELELEVVRSIGSKCNVNCVLTVGNFGCLLSLPHAMPHQFKNLPKLM